LPVGCPVGCPLGCPEGLALGIGVGAGEGAGDGAAEGRGVGPAVGLALGANVGNAEGCGDGAAVGLAVGSGVGAAVGCGVGSGLGAGVGSCAFTPTTISNSNSSASTHEDREPLAPFRRTGTLCIRKFPDPGPNQRFFDRTPLTSTRSCELDLYLASDNYYFKDTRCHKTRIYKVAEV